MSHQNVVEHTISTDDEEGVLSTYVPSDSPTEAGTTTPPPPSKIKKYAVPISMTLLALSAVAIAAVVWAPGGPGRPNSIQANLATTTRGTDTESEPTASVNDAPTFFPTSSTYLPTSSLNGTDSPVASPSTTSLPTSYVPTVDMGSTNSTESPVLPTTNNGTDSPVASPSTQAPTTPQATTYVPTVGNETEEIEETTTTTDVPSPKPTLPPLDLSWLSPTPPPMEESSSSLVPTSFAPTVAANTTSSVPTSTPTIESTGQGSATVSTETTGPPTAANRPPAPARM